MNWSNLQDMKCPKCGAKIDDDVHGLGYACMKCDFSIGYERFQKLINDMMMPKKPKYDPDKIDRSNWEW